MKILIATPLYPPQVGGPATYSKLLEKALPDREIEVELVKFTNVRHLPKVLRHAAYFFRVLKASRSAALVYALDPVSAGFPAMLAAKFARKPLIVKIVGDYAWEQGRQRFAIAATLDEFVRLKRVQFPLNVFQLIQRRVARAAGRIIVPSAYLKGIVEAWGIAPEKITVIWNAVEKEEQGRVPEAVARLPKPLVVGVGRLVAWKGFDVMLHAVASLHDDGVAASLVIAGDGPERTKLESSAKELLGVQALLTGSLAHKDAYALIESADVFVLDSVYEGLSHTLIEAFIAGVPVVVSDIGGNREIVQHEKNGLVVPPGDPHALAQALRRILSDSALRARLAAASKISGAQFSVETMIDKLTECLKKTV